MQAQEKEADWQENWKSRKNIGELASKSCRRKKNRQTGKKNEKVAKIWDELASKSCKRKKNRQTGKNNYKVARKLHELARIKLQTHKKSC
ncbi:hypothetical protein [Bacillus pinisoli]|uniref:hypothetical protein n=1 Tax=Bacillus pinisoli TaxID=2901866 RepID=UPI001FF48FA1|nr:hypothetical protein [Bacillus pinisoli]